jgi:hypothetical protein
MSGSWLARGAAAAVASTLVVAVSSLAPAASAAPAQSHAGSCPLHPQALPGNAIAGATELALSRASALYPGLDTRGAVATRAAQAAYAGVRGAQVVRECGDRVGDRTVVVEMLFPRMLPSASLSQSTVFVDRENGMYRVWQVAH